MFKPRVNTGELSLDGLEELAREFETSLLSTVVRAVRRVSDRPFTVAGIRKGEIAWMFPSNRLIEGKCYPGKRALESPEAKAQWQLFLGGNKERLRRGGDGEELVQELFGREEELFDASVTEDYLPIQIMSTLVVLLTLDEDDVFPEVEERDDDDKLCTANGLVFKSFVALA